MIWSIQQKALYECTLSLEDEVLKEAGLFPFFDGKGQTQAMMLTTSDSPKIMLLNYRADLFRNSPPWRKRLRLKASDLQDSSVDDAERIAELWHFDPWWELGCERYSGHSAVPPLKGTNIPGYDENITRVWYSSDLSRVTWVGSGHGEALKVKRFRPRLLEPARRQRGTAGLPAASLDRKSGWSLRPWW